MGCNWGEVRIRSNPDHQADRDYGILGRIGTDWDGLWHIGTDYGILGRIRTDWDGLGRIMAYCDGLGRIGTIVRVRVIKPIGIRP